MSSLVNVALEQIASSMVRLYTCTLLCYEREGSSLHVNSKFLESWLLLRTYALQNYTRFHCNVIVQLQFV